jgi:hypothetical protein
MTGKDVNAPVDALTGVRFKTGVKISRATTGRRRERHFYDSRLAFTPELKRTHLTGGMGQIIGKFRRQIGESMRLDTLTRPSDAEGWFFVIFVDGASPVHENHACRKKRRVRRRRELIANAGFFPDDGLIFLQYSVVYPIRPFD